MTRKGQIRSRFDPWVGETPWRRKWQPTPVFLPDTSHGWRSLAPWSHKESDMTEQLTKYTSHRVFVNLDQGISLRKKEKKKTERERKRTDFQALQLFHLRYLLSSKVKGTIQETKMKSYTN